MVETIQEEMLDDDKLLEEIRTWTSAQTERLNEIKNVKMKGKSKIMEKKEEVKLEELNHKMERRKIINEEAIKRLIKKQRELDESTKP